MSTLTDANRAQMDRRRIAVFLGPTLPWDKARSLLSADYYPPARKGDIYRILPMGVDTIILVDGVFHSTPSVWQREILDTMHEGVQVLGASSMGALRAAELGDLGMIGYGTVFGWYRDGVIDGDDEVALVHAPEELGFRPLSESLVNIRYTLLQAARRRHLDREEAQRLLDYAKQLYYPDRSYRRLLESPLVRRWPAQRRAQLEEYLLHKAVDIKRRDAVGVLRQAVRMRTAPRRRRPAPSVPGSVRHIHQHERLQLTGFFGEQGIVSGAQVLQEVQKDNVFVHAARARLSRRFFVLEWARQMGIGRPQPCREAAPMDTKVGHRSVPGKSWLQANGLTDSAFLALAEEQAFFNWLTKNGPAYFGLPWTNEERDERSQRCFVLAWAQRNGVSCPTGYLDQHLQLLKKTAGNAKRATRVQAGPPSSPSLDGLLAKRVLVDWITQQGPAYFGYDWRFEVALMQELQITGQAARIAAKVQGL